jgi:hypothetical protein
MDKYGQSMAKIVDGQNWLSSLPKGKIVDNQIILGDHVNL